MGYAFNTTIPAAGGGSVAISVSGQTLLYCQADVQVAYDENGFNTGQFALAVSGAASSQVLNFSNSGKTILWLRLDPAGGAPAATINVWTDIGSVNL